jgi:2-dehydro-3-deoxyphosphogluconate aldolase/(4S)-4-hydroxy-2-oxoglutarate aldolase
LGHAVPLAEALVEGGLNILEVTLRTPAALEAIAAGSAQVKGAIMGARTCHKQPGVCRRRGAKFVVSFKFFPAETSGGVPAAAGRRLLCSVPGGVGIRTENGNFTPNSRWRSCELLATRSRGLRL